MFTFHQKPKFSLVIAQTSGLCLDGYKHLFNAKLLAGKEYIFIIDYMEVISAQHQIHSDTYIEYYLSYFYSDKLLPDIFRLTFV